MFNTNPPSAPTPACIQNWFRSTVFWLPLYILGGWPLKVWGWSLWSFRWHICRCDLWLVTWIQCFKLRVSFPQDSQSMLSYNFVPYRGIGYFIPQKCNVTICFLPHSPNVTFMAMLTSNFKTKSTWPGKIRSPVWYFLVLKWGHFLRYDDVMRVFLLIQPYDEGIYENMTTTLWSTDGSSWPDQVRPLQTHENGIAVWEIQLKSKLRNTVEK